MGAEKEDLLQIGMIGLWQAIVDYRAEKEISFLSFARICIERHVITAIKTATRRKQTPLNTSVSLEYPSDDSDSEWNLADILVSDDTIDPEELVLKREDNNRLQDMLRRLLSDFEWRVLSGYQVGMIGLWQAIVDYRPEKEISFLSFARICIERHVITAIKTATRQKQTPLNSSVSLEYPSDDSDSEWNLAEILVSDDAVDPEELVLKNEDNNRLQDMLQRMLSEFEWRVLAGYQIGKSYREIACELQCKTKSVDNALARIKRKVSCAPHDWPGISDGN